MSEAREGYRIGQEDERLIYRGDKLYAVAFSATDAEAIVDCMNAAEGPGTFTDRDGDHWIRQSDGLYKMYDEGIAEELPQVRENYGSWGEAAS